MATFTLDTGRCPRWLFERMVKFGREMVRVIVAEEGPEKLIERLGDPVWFQSLGTVLAFDWNASGLTTILTAALKEAIRGQERDLGVFICGGKGKTARKTPAEITSWADRLALPDSAGKNLIYTSKMAAKVDSVLVQDGYQIYHHSFFFTRSGAWTVVQQGMDTCSVTARRYHWHSKNVTDLINEPHAGIASQIKVDKVLNLTARESLNNRTLSAELVSRGYSQLMTDIRLLDHYTTPVSQMARVKVGPEQLTFLNLEAREFSWHPVVNESFRSNQYLAKILWKLCDQVPQTYEQLLSHAGVGPKTMRALALVAEVIYGAKPSYRDPARYSFAHGGKDGTPYPVDRDTYDQTIHQLRRYVAKTN